MSSNLSPIDLQAALPAFLSYKRVHAGRIDSFERADDGSVSLRLEDYPYAIAFTASAEFSKRCLATDHDLGYLVVYQDGFISWSPTKAFEEGYTLLTEG